MWSSSRTDLGEYTCAKISVMDHTGRAIIVTGAASGIGRAATQIILDAGGSVVAVDRDADAFDWVNANEPGSERLVTMGGDVSQIETNEAAVAAALEHFGRLDACVLNAGVSSSGDLVDQPIEQFERALAVNVTAVILGVRAATPAIRESSDSGAFCVTASTSGLGGDPNMWSYNTTKGAVVNYVRSAALDLGPMGIRINAVAPGPTETGMTSRIQELPEIHESLRQRMALKRWGQPEEIGQVISFLVSPLASIVTGAIVPADGGMSASTGQFLPNPLP